MKVIFFASIFYTFSTNSFAQQKDFIGECIKICQIERGSKSVVNVVLYEYLDSTMTKYDSLTIKYWTIDSLMKKSQEDEFGVYHIGQIYCIKGEYFVKIRGCSVKNVKGVLNIAYATYFTFKMKYNCIDNSFYAELVSYTAN
jgi:hypothetical protein